MNQFDMIKYWDPKTFWLDYDKWTKAELKLILMLLKRNKITLEEEK